MALYRLPDGTVIGVSNAGFQTVDLPSGYNLAAAVAAVPFTVNLPTEPTITSEATCTTVAEVNASVAVNGRRTIIAAGTYNFGGALSIGGNDKQIVCQPGAVLNLTELQLSGSRILIDDATLVSSGQYGVRLSTTADVRFNRLNLDADDGGFFMYNAQRVLFVNSIISAYTHVAYLDDLNSDLTIANSNCEGLQPLGGINGWCIRWGAGTFTNSVLMDSRFRAEQNVTLRYEVSQQNGYFARNQIEGNNPFRTEGRDTGTPSLYPLDNMHVLDNQIYSLSASEAANFIVTTYPRMTDVTVIGNTIYSATAPLADLGFPSGQTGWTLSDNNYVDTVTYVPPPAWSMQ